MRTIKNTLFSILLLYIAFAVLLWLNVFNKEFFLNLLSLENLEAFYANLFAVGVVLLVLLILVENVIILLLKNESRKASDKINELKALLYDKEKELKALMNSSKSEEFPETNKSTQNPEDPGTYLPGYEKF